MKTLKVLLFFLITITLAACVGGDQVQDSPEKGLGKTEIKTVVGEGEVAREVTKIDKEIAEKELGSADLMDVFDPDFANGKWEADDQNGFSFSTWFYVEDGILKGQYCAINEDASRIDCGTQDEVDLCYLMSESVLDVKELEIEVVSCYSQKHGRAKLVPYGDGQLKWVLTESPGAFGVDHFAPTEAILFKISFDPFE